MKTDKQTAYESLVKARKVCHLCEKLTNPSEYKSGIFDTDHIGPWSQWQGNLDAKLMIVGQDWGGTTYFEKYKGHEADNNPSNKTLSKLLASIQIEIDSLSLINRSHESIFLTNAILCLKDGGLAAPVKSVWFYNCGQQFLKPTIDLVRPKVIASLGVRAFEAIRRLYGLPKMRFRNAVDQQAGLVLPNGALFFAMYHCSPQVINTHTRTEEQQLADWQRVKSAL